MAIVRSYKLIIFILAQLVAAELLLEVRAARQGYDTLLFGPGSEVGAAHDAEPASDDYPFRGRPPSPEKPLGAVRVWVASASQAEDEHLPLEQIFPTVLERDLSGNGVPCEVLNGSRAGDTIPDNLGQLERHFPRWRPDVVVLYQMALDINRLTRQFAAGSADGPAEATPLKAPVPWAVRMFEQTSIYSLMKANLTPAIAAEQVLHQSLPAAVNDRYCEEVEGFIRRVQALGARPVLCTFACRYSATQDDAMTGDIRQSLLRYNHFLAPGVWPAAVELLNERIRQIGRQRGVTVIDIAADVAGRPELFRDFVHFTPAGHAVVARAIADELRDALPQVRSANQPPDQPPPAGAR